MKCVRIKDKQKLEISDIKPPVSDGKNVIIEVSKSGICGSDLHNYELGEPKGLIMGHEFSGIVLDKGSRKDLEVGDRVTALPISPCMNCPACNKGYLNYCSNTWKEAVGLSIDNPGGLTSKIKVREDMVIKLDDNITDEEAALVEPTAVGFHAVNLADIKVGDKVLIIGGGIIGLVSAMFAKLEGAVKVTLLETNKNRGIKALNLGVVDEFINVSDTNEYNNFLATSSSSYDKVIECCGNSNAVTSSLIFTKPGSTIVLVGVSPTSITIPTVIAVMNELVIKGAIAYTKEEFIKCIELISNKKIDVLKFLDKVISLEEVDKEYKELYSGNSNNIKVLVDLKNNENNH